MATVLLVDDERSIVDTFHIFLAKAGHQPTAAFSFEEARQFLENNTYDIIISDIILGARSGLELLHIINERKMPAAFIVVTGQPSIETTVESIRMGAYEYVSKPLRKDDLLRLVSKAEEHTQLLARHIELEKQLRRAERRYRTVFEHSKDGIAVFQLHEGSPPQLIECNKAYAALSGRTQEELQQLDDLDAVRVYEDASQTAATINEKLLADRAVSAVYSWVRPDGVENYVQMDIVTSSHQDEAMAYSIDRDITGERRSKNDMQAMIDAVPQYVMLYDTDGRILAANSRTAAFFGLTVEQLAGKRLEEFFGPQVEQDRLQRLKRFTQDPSPVTVQLAYNGVDLFITARPLLNDHGGVDRIVSYVVTDELER